MTDASSLSADTGHYPLFVSSTKIDNRAASVMAMATENQERLASAKILSSKAQAGTYNIGVWLAVMEELERGLTVLDSRYHWRGKVLSQRQPCVRIIAKVWYLQG